MPGEFEIRVTIGDLLDSQTERYGDREALVHVETGKRYTYREFKDECDRVARGLMALGIEKGQHVGRTALPHIDAIRAAQKHQYEFTRRIARRLSQHLTQK